MFSSGSFSKFGVVGGPGMALKALDSLRNSESASMPFWVLRISGRAMVLDAF